MFPNTHVQTCSRHLNTTSAVLLRSLLTVCIMYATSASYIQRGESAVATPVVSVVVTPEVRHVSQCQCIVCIHEPAAHVRSCSRPISSCYRQQCGQQPVKWLKISTPSSLDSFSLFSILLHYLVFTIFITW